MSAPGPHDGFFTIDTHIDTPTASLMRPGWDFAARHDRAADRSQCDLPRMAEGGLELLAELGWTDTLLLERDRLTSGTTWHAAGLVGQLRATQNLTKLARYSIDLYGALLTMP